MMLDQDQYSRLRQFEGQVVDFYGAHVKALHYRGRGRDNGYPMPPAQIRTCSITAYGSCLR